MITRILSESDSEIVTLEEAMEHSRITDSYDEMVVQMCLDSATDIIEKYLNRRLTPTTMIGVVEDYRSKITLPFPPINSVTSVTCEDSTGTEVTLEEDTHYKYDEVYQAIRFLDYQYDFSNYSQFKVTFTCGYEDVDCVPRAVKHAIRMTFATLYENREDTIIGASIATVPLNAKRACRAYRVRPV